MARSNVVTQEKYDDVKHLLKLDKFTQKEIANIVEMSNVTVYKIRISKDIEDYRAIVKKRLGKKCEAILLRKRIHKPNLWPVMPRWKSSTVR